MKVALEKDCSEKFKKFCRDHIWGGEGLCFMGYSRLIIYAQGAGTQKMKFSIKDFLSIAFTEKIHNGKLHFLCNEYVNIYSGQCESYNIASYITTMPMVIKKYK